MKEWYSAKELAGLPGMPGTDRAIQIKAEKNNWPSRPRAGRGGGREYHISALPADTRIALAGETSRQYAESSRQQTLEGPLAQIGPIGPMEGKANAGLGSRLRGNNRQEVRGNDRQGMRRNDNPLPVIPARSLPTIPDKARRIALARLDLLRLWDEYRRTHTKATDADREFVTAYNTRLLLPHLQDILGNVSAQTLYRWRAALGGTPPQTGDWTLLVPGYYAATEDKSRLAAEEERVFLGLLLHPNKIKVGSAIRLMRYHFERQGITLDRSDMTYRRFAEDFKARRYDQWVLMREGQKALTDKVNFTITRDPGLLEVGEVLVADGHRLDFQVVNPYTGKPGRATIVGYIDWKSWDLAGYEIMMEENTQCIASAFRNAVLTLGAHPRVLYLDNGRAFRARFFTSTETFDEAGIYGIFARLGVSPVFARPYNARAKVIERWFQEFGNTFERLLPSFTGTSIADKPAHMMRNEKFHKALHAGRGHTSSRNVPAISGVPTIAETIELIALWREFLRSQPCPHVKGKTIGEVFDQGKGPGVNPAELDDLMMTMKITRIERRGIRFLNADYYDDALYGLREQVMIRYSLFDLSSIKVYTVKGEPICEAVRVEAVHPVARISGTKVDMDAVTRQIALQKSLEKRTFQGVKELVKARKDVALDWEKVTAISPKIVEKLEDAGVELPAIEARIPDEAVKVKIGQISQIGPITAEAEPGTRPFFSGPSMDVDRYEWHLTNGFHTSEDRSFKLWFEGTDTYRLLYVVIPADQAAADKKAAIS
jgi:putative transposase